MLCTLHKAIGGFPRELSLTVFMFSDASLGNLRSRFQIAWKVGRVKLETLPWQHGGWVLTSPCQPSNQLMRPGCCLLPTLWFRGWWPASSLHPRLGAHGKMWSLWLHFLRSLPSCPCLSCSRRNFIPAHHDFLHNANEWTDEAIVLGTTSLWLCFFSVVVVVAVVHWKSYRAFSLWVSMLRCITQAQASGYLVSPWGKYLSHFGSAEAQSVLLQMIGWKHLKREQPGSAPRWGPHWCFSWLHGIQKRGSGCSCRVADLAAFGQDYKEVSKVPGPWLSLALCTIPFAFSWQPALCRQYGDWEEWRLQ